MNSEKKIVISDSTMKYLAGCSFREKLDCVRLLGKTGTDVIEFGRLPDGDKSASLLCRTASTLLGKCTVSVEVDSRESVDSAMSALSSAACPRLSVSLPISTVQTEYSYHRKPAAMIQIIGDLLSYARGKCGDVELRIVDATRGEKGVLYGAVKEAVDARVSFITLCDSTGERLPDEFASLVSEVASLTGGRCPIGVECSDRLGLSVASAIDAVKAGATKVSCSFTPGSVPLIGFTKALAVRGKDIGVYTDVDSTLLSHTSDLINGSGEKAHQDAPQTKSDVLSEDAGVSAASDISAVCEAVRRIGYELSDADKIAVYENFRRLVEKSGKDKITDRELDAIVASGTLRGTPTYTLGSYVINSGNLIASTAHITLEKDGGKLSGFCDGDGPIDAAFRAIEQIIGHHYELDDFRIQAVTEGREAMGDALVRLRYEGVLYSGRGLSTDIIGASIRAYVAALNKITAAQK